MKPTQSNDLEYIFHPNSIAFAGVSRTGQTLLENHLTSVFKGNYVSHKQDSNRGIGTTVLH